MKKTISEVLDEIIEEVENMSEEELEAFLDEGYERAKHVLDIEYDNME